MKSYVFYSGRIRTLVAMATYSSHRLKMGKVEIYNFFCLNGDIYVPPTEGGGGILFLVRIPSASASAELRFRVLSFEPMDGF